MTAVLAPAAVTFDVWSTSARLLVTDPDALPAARILLDAVLTDVERAASRFRPDAEIAGVVARPGRPVPLSDTLDDLVTAALHAARATDGLVDPTVAGALIALGYDDDLGAVIARTVTAATAEVRPAPGYGRLRHDPDARTLAVPAGVGLDLGASAKAYAADRAAARIAGTLGVGVLVSLGGDLAVAGPAPADGWAVEIADDHRPGAPADQIVAVVAGGLATSSIATRRWLRGDTPTHHIVDPRTGMNPPPYWRTVSVVAATCVDANAAATAAIVRGAAAESWLTGAGLAARLVHVDGTVHRTGGWPASGERA